MEKERGRAEGRRASAREIEQGFKALTLWSLSREEERCTFSNLAEPYSRRGQHSEIVQQKIVQQEGRTCEAVLLFSGCNFCLGRRAKVLQQVWACFRGFASGQAVHSSWVLCSWYNEEFWAVQQAGQPLNCRPYSSTISLCIGMCANECAAEISCNLYPFYLLNNK